MPTDSMPAVVVLQSLIMTMFGIYTARGHKELSQVQCAPQLSLGNKQTHSGSMHVTGPPAVLAPAVQQLQDAHAVEHGRQDGPHHQNIRASLVPA